ncbi:protein DpdJ [Mesorhizobium sp.]|uniref:protein DpdJ n=1 Tax=Mesorhizobium sp. TaxID=1871066 RepID=UPI000FE4ADE1|nr:protein DpdJ [Mesorhizobium sp.]RWO54256.1 MAG: DEAD/DEAH box helicase [Mesorhizobium sp.]
MTIGSPTFVSDFLNFIEECELRLQNWGFYDVAFDEADLSTLIETDAPDRLREAWDALAQDGIELGTVLAQMRRADLLHLVPNGSGRIRSRFAEGLRLLAHLRQRFGYQDWASGRRLVADIKLHLAPRRYPAIGITADTAWACIAPHASQPTLQRAVFEALASRADGGAFTFAGFQVRSFERIFRSYGAEEQNGTVVCASTGAGKTKAFYIPAFTAIAPELGKFADRFTKVIAVYPRNVLLADQLREAIAEAGKLGAVLNANAMRPITVGALLGDLPPAGHFDLADKSPFLKQWKRVHNRGWVVPFLRAPFHTSRGELVWLDADRKAGRTTLYRIDALDEPPEIPDAVIQLTREGLQANPPDILFLSLEMMNRELGNPLWAKTFGIGVNEKPRLFLFDEVHNYSGLSGAQAPWIVARWRQAARPKGLHVVGLSATLRDAPKHLGTIGCVNPERIVECTPMDDELEPEGRDYTVIVKGDAGSGASLLATSIQAAMLQSRLLTPAHVSYPTRESLAGGSLYLRKVFGFTDQLDSLNRWLPDLDDAEWNRLAQYRLPPNKSGQTVSHATERAMLADGQIWSLPDTLGHDLRQSARVSRCSSQDPGADTSSDIIVATASLEVGYDDPDVGAVIHHKAPRSIASFLQRKGRAGRTRGSRPTTLIVLSDWGRDRWLFQNSERLFQPEVESIKVPLLNPYVQHVQATNFLLDWVGRRVGAADPVRYLRRPAKYDAAARGRAIALLRRLLDLGDDYAAFHRELGWVVRRTQRFGWASDEDIDRIVDTMLWEAPRPVLRHAVPSLLRKLEAEWRFADPSRDNDREDSGARQPLPSFIPAASFADLAASDVTVDFPGTNKDVETRGIAPQLIESCPGRVSKRFSVRRQEHGYWLAGSEQLLTASSPVMVPARQFFPDTLAIGTDQASAALQPLRMALVERPRDVKDSSNAAWLWMNSAECVGDGRSLPMLGQQHWQEIFDDTRAYLHGDLNAVLIRRRTSEGRFDILMNRGVERRGSILLGSTSDNGEVVREPVGFEQTVDAIVFRIRAEHLRVRPALDDATMGRLRQDYFKRLLMGSLLLREAASSFTLEWVWQTSLAMLTATALKAKCSLEAAQSRLEGKRIAAIGRVLSRMFSVSALDDEDADDHHAGGKARQRLEALWSDSACAAEITRAETALWSDPDEDFEAWLRQRHLQTLAEACLSAVHAVATDVGEGDLMVDVLTEDGNPLIVISESAPGGIGQIESFVQTSLDGEGTFERALAHALGFCTRAHISENLIAVAARARTPGALADAFDRTRRARGYHQALSAQQGLTGALEEAGLGASRQNVVAVTGRLLQPSSNSTTDAWFDSLNRLWANRERRLGAPIDAGVFAYVLADSPYVRRRFSLMIERITGQQPGEAQLFARIQDFLLPGCHDSCPQCLANTNRFASDIRPSRELTAQWLCASRPATPSLSISPGWVERLHALLMSEDRVEIIGGADDLAEIARTLQTLLTEPFERDYLLVWPILSGVSRNPDGWRVGVEIRNMGVR